MSAIISRMVWFLVFASAVSYATYLVAGSIVHAESSGKNQSVIIRDELGAGVHHLSGMVMVPSTCDQLSVRTESIGEGMYKLVFRTWHEPSVSCVFDETPRYFRAILFAPSAGVQFIATLDGVGLPIFVMPVLPAALPRDI